jgi:hypothetical protein
VKTESLNPVRTDEYGAARDHRLIVFAASMQLSRRAFPKYSQRHCIERVENRLRGAVSDEQRRAARIRIQHPHDWIA